MGDAVNHPAHYMRGQVEVIDAIEAWELDFHRGNAVKYIARAGLKDRAKELEDLEKARWYLERAILRLREVQARQAQGPLTSALEDRPKDYVRVHEDDR